MKNKTIRWKNMHLEKPPRSGFYFWRYQRKIGGWSWFDKRSDEFDFDSMVPKNIRKDELFWLDENAEDI
jgi:hypothetical protein